MTKKQRALQIIERLKEEYPQADCTLEYDQAWKLLVSVRLAAQCTDARVNVVVEGLYEKFPDVEALANAPVEEIEEIVHPCGLGKSKARDISACMRMLRDEYDGKVPEDFDKLTEAINNSAGTTEEMASIMQDNATGAFERLKSAVNVLFTQMSEHLIPAFTAIVEKVTEVINWFGSLDEGTQKLILTIAGIAAAVGPVLIVIGKIITAIGTISGAVSGVVGIVTKGITSIIGIGGKLMGGIKSLFALIMAHPVVAVVTAVVGAVVLLYTKCEWFRDAVHAVIEAVVGFFKGAWEVVVSVWNAAGEFFGGIVGGIKGAFDGIGEFIGGLFKSAWEAVRSAWNGAKEFFSGIWEGIKSVFSTVAEVIGGVFRTAWEMVQNAWNGAKEFFSGIWDGIKSVFSAAAEVIGGAFWAAWEAASGAWDAASPLVSRAYLKLLQQRLEVRFLPLGRWCRAHGARLLTSSPASGKASKAALELPAKRSSGH